MMGDPGAVHPGARLRDGAAAGGKERIGLVLSGGGAKGAYQAGAVTALADAGTQISAVSGASIGALNAAIVAAAPDLRQAAQRLTALWREVGETAGRHSTRLPAEGVGDTVAQAARALELVGNPVLRPDFLDSILRRHLDPSELRNGLPLWVSAFPTTLPEWAWVLDLTLGAFGAQPEWIHVNPLPYEDALRALRASAALPVITPSVHVQGRRYRDGGIGDNTPARPLITHAACETLVVVHLSRGVLWDAQSFPGASIVEVRPLENLNGRGSLSTLTGMIDFSPRRLADLELQGRQDARRVLETVAEVLTSENAHKLSETVMLERVQDLDAIIAASQSDTSASRILSGEPGDEPSPKLLGELA